MAEKLRRKTKLNKKQIAAVVICVIAALILPILIFIFYVLGFSSNPKVTYDASSKTQSEAVTVYDLNIRYLTTKDLGEKSWFKRAPHILTQIAQAEPDIICLQEVTPSQKGYFDAALKGFSCVYKYRKAGYSEATPIYFSNLKFELIDSGSFWLSETPEKQSKDWDSGSFRICSFAFLRDKATDKRLAVFNTHLDNESDEARINGIGVVLSQMEKFSAYPSILTGDMNSRKGSSAYKKATEYLLNSRLVADNTMFCATYNGWGESNPKALPIDFCFASKSGVHINEYKIINSTVEGQYTSDHYALQIKLTLD